VEGRSNTKFESPWSSRYQNKLFEIACNTDIEKFNSGLAYLVEVSSCVKVEVVRSFHTTYTCILRVDHEAKPRKSNKF
jgi:hypothetical protein